MSIFKGMGNFTKHEVRNIFNRIVHTYLSSVSLHRLTAAAVEQQQIK